MDCTIIFRLEKYGFIESLPRIKEIIACIQRYRSIASYINRCKKW